MRLSIAISLLLVAAPAGAAQCPPNGPIGELCQRVQALEQLVTVAQQQLYDLTARNAALEAQVANLLGRDAAQQSQLQALAARVLALETAPPGSSGCPAGESVVCCPAGRRFCGQAGCVDTSTSNSHCGACGNACAQGFVCIGGTCGVACANAGACGTVGDTCQDGLCRCGAGPACGIGKECRGGRCISFAVDAGLFFDLDAANFHGGTVWPDSSPNSYDFNLASGMDATWNAGGWFDMPGNGAHAVNRAATLGSHGSLTIEVVAGFLVAGSRTLIEQSATGTGGERDIASLKHGTGPCSSSVHMGGFATVNGQGVFCMGGINGGAWSYWQIVYDGSTVRYYENRNLRATLGRSGPTLEMKRFYIGKLAVDGDLREPMQGRMAIVRMYDRALTSQELQANYDVVRARFALP